MTINTAFHPAVRGILEAALTQHEQARALINITEGTSESADRYSEIIQGLNRLMTIVTPAQFGILPATRLERVHVCFQMASRMLTALSDFELSAWSFGRSDDGVEAMLSSRDVGARTTIREIADRIGVSYAERRHGTKGQTLMIEATGDIDGVTVRFWKLIDAERPFCDVHHLMLTEADVCEQCENPGVDLTAESPAATVQDEDQFAPRTMAQTRGHGQDDVDQEPDGTKCMACGLQIAADEISVPFDTAGGGQVFRHFACATDNELAVALLLDDALVSHAANRHKKVGPLCGDTEPDPVFSNHPTCPTCRSLRAADRADTNPGDTQ